MRRLVSRFIHQWKKQMRQDGVNEDDLLEIKQDISSLRYELREDRKRESARTSSHIETVKRDVIRSIHQSNPSMDHACVVDPMSEISQAVHRPPSPSYAAYSPPTLSFLNPSEIDALRKEIIIGLKAEIRELAMEMVRDNGNNAAAPSAPSLNAELYHTHLYTQL
ncbi:unnamed protein product [Dimorphilus gyrociliatus]|uniref:Uncharacterized protein n=1 Tax=Dimorphilus gyrociliatus TaxID=2664684 RepID=A0A7I8VHH3_9ANNE|nr:unnamed protein product [Dimorphilus gyrociliatus]